MTRSDSTKRQPQATDVGCTEQRQDAPQVVIHAGSSASRLSLSLWVKCCNSRRPHSAGQVFPEDLFQTISLKSISLLLDEHLLHGVAGLVCYPSSPLQRLKHAVLCGDRLWEGYRRAKGYPTEPSRPHWYKQTVAYEVGEESEGLWKLSPFWKHSF